MGDKLFVALAITAAVLGWSGLAYQAHKCRQAGGVFVQGLIVFECINQPKE